MKPRIVSDDNKRGTGMKIGLILLGVWLVIRLAFVLPVFQEPLKVQLIDLNTYVELATSMLERGIYEGYSRDNIDLWRTPGYPVFAAAILGITGQNLAYLALTQVLLTLLTCFLVYQIAGRLFNDTVALAAAWIFALDPNTLFFALTALTETFFTLLLILSIYLLVRFHFDGQRRWMVLSAVVLGLGVLVRPIATWFVPLWALFIFLSQREAPPRNRFANSLLFLGIAWLIFFPWQVRNAVVNDQFTLSPVGRKTIENWMIAEGLAEAKGITRNEAAAEISNSPDEQAYILEIIQAYPKDMVVAQVRGFYRTLMGFEYGTWTNLLGVEPKPGRDFLNTALARNVDRAWQAGVDLIRDGYFAQAGVIIWALGFNLLLYSLVLSALLFPRKNVLCWLCLILVLLTAAYLLFSPFGAGQARFRIPATPLLALLGGMGVAGWLSLGPRLFRFRDPEEKVAAENRA